MKTLSDIEDIVEVPDYTIYILLFIFIATVLSIYFGYKLYKKRRDRKPTKKEVVLEAYKNIDLSNSKKAAYLITKYGYILAKDEKSKEILKELTTDLARYKYEKEVEDFDEKSLGLYNLFLEVVTHE